MTEQIQYLATSIEQIIILLGYAGIVILMFADQWILPLPAALILGFAGFATVDSTVQLSFGLVLLASTFGSVLGALSIYMLVRQVNADRVFALVGRYGKWVGLSEQRLASGMAWFQHSAGVMLLAARLVPAMRTLISWPAGLSQVSPGRFVWTTVLGCGIFNIVMLYGGRQMKSNWPMLLTYVQRYEHGIGLLLGLLVLGCLARWTYTRFARTAQR